MDKDIIGERVSQGKCPVCNKPILEGEGWVEVTHRDRMVKIHSNHIDK